MNKLLLSALLDAYLQSKSRDYLRVLHLEDGWTVACGDAVLMRSCGSTAFDTPEQAFRVLAGVGIRCAVVEWDGLEAFVEKSNEEIKSHIEQALSIFIGSLADSEVRAIGAYGGYIGLSRDADQKDLSFSDFELLAGHENWGGAREKFVSGCVFELEAQQTFDEGELLPVAEEDDEGVTPERLTSKVVERLRNCLMEEVTSGVWVEQIFDATSAEE